MKYCSRIIELQRWDPKRMGLYDVTGTSLWVQSTVVLFRCPEVSSVFPIHEIDRGLINLLTAARRSSRYTVIFCTVRRRDELAVISPCRRLFEDGSKLLTFSGHSKKSNDIRMFLSCMPRNHQGYLSKFSIARDLVDFASLEKFLRYHLLLFPDFE